MIKNILFIVTFIFSLFTFNYAEILNVVTDSDTALIKLNKVDIGISVVTNYKIKTGTYLLTVEDNGAEIYSELIEITNDQEVTTISIKLDNQLAKEVIDSKKQKQFASYALDKKGDLGLGFYTAPTSLSGLKLSYDIDPFTIQTIFWLSQSNTSKYFVGGIRFINYFNNQYTKHTLFRLYSGLGYIYGDLNGTIETNTEIPFGAEFKLRQQLPKAPIWSYLIFSYMALGYNLMASIDGLFYFVETGLTLTESTNNDNDYTGLKFALGLKYYF
tara:strand:- start:7467 stop:8282 length:816 start_codon:yes stop_codon:yes gene_type:complete